MIEITSNSSQNINSTASPQSTESTSTSASDASQFQQSANASELNANHTVSVAETGQPVNSSVTNPTSSNDWWTTLAILAVVAIFVLVLKWLIGFPFQSIKKSTTTKKSAAKTTKSKRKN